MIVGGRVTSQMILTWLRHVDRISAIIFTRGHYCMGSLYYQPNKFTIIIKITIHLHRLNSPPKGVIQDIPAFTHPQMLRFFQKAPAS